MSNNQQIPSEAFRFRAGNGSVKSVSETGSFELAPYKLGQLVEHWYWGKFLFEVSSAKMYKDTIPALVDHDTAKGCGKITAMKKDNGLQVTGEFIDNEHAKYVRSMNGLMECSLRFNESRTDIEEIKEGNKVEVDGVEHEGPLVVFRNAEIMEVSFTLFGAIPNTTTSFNKGFIMADTPKIADPSAVIEKMSALCKDASFVLQCFKKGMSVDEFASSLVVKQNLEIEQFKVELQNKDAEIAELKTKMAKQPTGVAPVAFGAPVAQASAEPKTYMEAIAKFKAEGKDQKTAMSMACGQYPELYKSFTGRV